MERFDMQQLKVYKLLSGTPNRAVFPISAAEYSPLGYGAERLLADYRSGVHWCALSTVRYCRAARRYVGVSIDGRVVRDEG